MNPLKLIACDTLVGLPRKPYGWFHPDVADLRSELERLQITSAIVRHRQCLENSPDWGNQVLRRELAADSSLIPAVCLTPDGVPDAHSLEATMASELGRGMRIAWISPREHMFSLRPWCSQELYSSCAAARLPLLLDYRQASLDEVNEIMVGHPSLRLILLQVPRLGRHRTLYRLLERHPSLHLCLSSAYSVHEGIAGLVASFGANRFVWGSSYPEAEGGAAVTLLTYADIPDAARRAIAHGNIERLISEVQP